ncbi:Gfo/Idh/MocA family protein [Primorskyibacter sp. S187A]|uniref:Gfo/Idh/MocA family protein n=1 Tax=Primorskyibacter sp. S187A TaxID=3415130 RepID=UPI003C7BAE28
MTQDCRIAVVGYGLVGRRHADVVRRTPGLSLAGIVEPGDVARKEAARSGTPVFAELEAMLEDLRPEGVVLATPTPLHRVQALQCISRSIPVLIEKPIAVSVVEALDIVQASNAADIPVLVGHHRRYNGMVSAAKAAVVRGDLGAVRAVQATCWFYKPDSYFDEAPWRKQPGAGPISVNLVHDIDLLQHLCGKVAQVYAVAVPARRGYANEDLATAVLTFASGAVGSITVSDAVVSPWSWELTAGENPVYPATLESCYQIGGSEGGLSLPDLRIWRHQDTSDWWRPISATSLTAERPDPLVAQMVHFADVIAGRATPLVSAQDGMDALQVVEAIATSAAKGCSVEIPGVGAA